MASASTATSTPATAATAVAAEPEEKKSDSRPKNFAIKTARTLGFTKTYNFALFTISAGALLGFALARAMYLDIHGVLCGGPLSPTRHAAPGECFYYGDQGKHEAVGIVLHVGTVIPSAFLVCLQFVPKIRRWRSHVLHRMNGRVLLLLSVVSEAGVLMIARRAFGGTVASQTAIGLLSLVFLGALGMAWWNVRRLQIEQHRAWMLRAWFYAGSIITTRLIMFIAASVISHIGGYYMAEPCEKLDSIMGSRNKTLASYPGCEPFFTGANPNQHALVYASMAGKAENIGAALDLNFGAALWMAMALHAVGVELYLQLTPAESERLRNVSYQRQLEAGVHDPGRAGLTVDRLGDAERWRPRRTGGVGSRSGSRSESRSQTREGARRAIQSGNSASGTSGSGRRRTSRPSQEDGVGDDDGEKQIQPRGLEESKAD